ncbi:MAG: hypothetical protein WDM92_08865 [Caulobacteraceae bacterium]
MYLVYELVFGVILVSLHGDKLAAMLETNRTDPVAALGMLPGLGPLFLIALALTFTLWSAMSEAVYRGLLERDGEPGYLRLGRDELRMGALILSWAALFLGYTFLLVFVAALAGAPAAALPVWLRPIYLLLVLAATVVGFVYPVVRLSLSFPMTVAANHIRIFESWHLTRGRFWPLLGAYLLSWVLIMVVQLVAMIVIVALAALVILSTGGSFSNLSGVFSPDYSSLGAYFSPARLISMLCDAPVSAALLAIAAGPSAEAFRVFSGGAPTPPLHFLHPLVGPTPRAAKASPPEPAILDPTQPPASDAAS